MGHVDHGKTLLLDRIRNSNVIRRRGGRNNPAHRCLPGGMARSVADFHRHTRSRSLHGDARSRGASGLTSVVLVVAADDGVMPQTVEAINPRQGRESADRGGHQQDRQAGRRSQSCDAAAVRARPRPEAWGGDTITVEISALQSFGIDELLEQLVVLAEVLELTADTEVDARGVVLESNLDIGRGPVATIIVQRGTLRVGEPIVAGAAWGVSKL